MPPEWARDLRRRRGATRRLAGITVYHDFRWTEVFRDERTQFKHGLSLARLVSTECPAGKRPALLLTVDDEAEEGPIETDEEYIAVIRIRSYLAEATGDAAAAYYAHRYRRGITRLGVLDEIGRTPGLLASLLDDHLTADLVEGWAAQDPDRMRQLMALGSVKQQSSRQTMNEVVDALRQMAEMPAGVWKALIDLLPNLLDPETRLSLLHEITRDEPGRVATAEAIGARIAERIADARDAASEYNTLVGSPTSTETDLQAFIENHPWMVGLDYVSIRPKPDVPRGQLDFILERFDGLLDLLELKSPQDPIISSSEVTDRVPPPANKYRLSAGLANALAQVHVYRDLLTVEAGLVERQYGLARSRNPRLVIVIGRVSAMTDDRQRVLEQLNLSLHRVEVVPYDILGRRAEGWLSNIETYLSAAPR